MKTIELGVESGGLYPEPVGVKEDTKRKHYPTLYVNDVDLEGLPNEGKAMVRYCIQRFTKTVSGDDKEVSFSAELEIKSITPMHEKEDSEHELDRLRREVEDES
jgi:hypothetical protein